VDPVKQLNLFRMIAEAGYSGMELSELVRRVGIRLNECGLPVARLGIGFPTLHPSFYGFDVNWIRRGDEVVRSQWQRPTGEINTEEFDSRPFSYMRARDMDEMLVDLSSNEPTRFPLLETLREGGATGYLATCDKVTESRHVGPLNVFFTSWTTDRPAGFTEEDLTIIRSLVPAIGVAARALSADDVAYDLLKTYLGCNAGQKVIAGSVHRGAVEVIDAAIIYSDLVGFTRTADQESKEDLADLLNAYFDEMVGVIRDHSGEVLKFIGDGMLAIIPYDGDPATAKEALDAAAEIILRTDALTARRETDGKLTAEVSVALHRGELLYGNVGAQDRLDFTVIGPAVNEASRIEALCREQQRRLIISSAFAESATTEAHRLISMGRFALRGVRKPQELFTLALEPGALDLPHSVRP